MRYSGRSVAHILKSMGRGRSFSGLDGIGRYTSLQKTLVSCFWVIASVVQPRLTTKIVPSYVRAGFRLGRGRVD